MSCNKSAPDRVLYSSPEFSVFSSYITQSEFTGKAISATHLSSNYQSPANAFQPAEVVFKFALNGRDNEMPPGVDHRFALDEGVTEAVTPEITFGQALQQKSKEGVYLQPNTKITIRCNLKPVLDAFEKDGYYTTYNGNKLYKQDFKGVFIAGANTPLSWDFDNLDRRPQFRLTDDDGDGIFTITLVFNPHDKKPSTAAEWRLRNDVSAYPVFKSDHLIADAVYNLALDEMINAIEPDSTLRTGKEWAGVWTRDVSYSIILAMAVLQPEVAKKSLRKKVQNDRIIQDTGTGGAWPVSTDRIIWATAAYEIYKVTGERDWLEYAASVVKNSIDDDLIAAKDPATGLMRGESSFLDWREQTYPRWMQPADIYSSLCLGTNAAHFAAMQSCASMFELLDKKAIAEKYMAEAEALKNAINQHFWDDELGYYVQFLYGRSHFIKSPKAEALGEALCVLFGIADSARAEQLIAKTPVTPYGITCIYPQIPLIPPYHNNGVWPFVQSYWGLAAAKAGNEKSFMHSLASVYRAASMFVTNKENFVAENGDFAGTVINSDNMLWSLSGSIGLVYKGLFGLRYENSALNIKPFVPKAFEQGIHLSQYKYRNARLDIRIKGFGNKIKKATINGKTADKVIIPADAQGDYLIDIVMNDVMPEATINLQPNAFAPNTPEVKLEGSLLKWHKVSDATSYQVLKNGKPFSNTTATQIEISVKDFGVYQVIALAGNGMQSFASEPIEVLEGATMLVAKPSLPSSQFRNDIIGASGNGFVETFHNRNQIIPFEININRPGNYLIRVRYANGNGPVNTENKCAFRTLYINDTLAGMIVLPQRGHLEWSDWGLSSYVMHNLKTGRHLLTLKYMPWNRNMNGDINHAFIDRLELIKIADELPSF